MHTYFNVKCDRGSVETLRFSLYKEYYLIFCFYLENGKKRRVYSDSVLTSSHPHHIPRENVSGDSRMWLLHQQPSNGGLSNILENDNLGQGVEGESSKIYIRI